PSRFGRGSDAPVRRASSGTWSCRNPRDPRAPGIRLLECQDSNQRRRRFLRTSSTRARTGFRSRARPRMRRRGGPEGRYPPVTCSGVTQRPHCPPNPLFRIRTCRASLLAPDMSKLLLPAVLRPTVVHIHSLVNNYYQILSHPLVGVGLANRDRADQCVARGPIDVLSELDRSPGRVKRGSLHCQEGSPSWFIEQSRLIGRGA